MLRKIFAVCSARDYYSFIKRTKEENLDIGQTLAALVHVYAQGSIEIKGWSNQLSSIRSDETEKRLKLEMEEQLGNTSVFVERPEKS